MLRNGGSEKPGACADSAPEPLCLEELLPDLWLQQLNSYDHKPVLVTRDSGVYCSLRDLGSKGAIPQLQLGLMLMSG